MSEVIEPLIVGSVTEEHFLMLLDGTKISGEAVVAALRDHLVGGMTAKAVIEKHDLNKSHFYTRLTKIKAAHEYAARISKFYTVVPTSTVVAASDPRPVDATEDGEQN
ncbi:adhesin biosynthesis transcription regulatory family protein [Pseudomonas sp. UMAB-40]|uniref:adhesin biosynthesis transcription regulatory family protein n=1 Tax=Pseudomonas sp. UMAB-40 TaxID=1365407 RepID=UPI001C59A8EA|nr:adhesin biosynthesis transcription regulatory family protein [Pseudomonas sp. UMAB-40]